MNTPTVYTPSQLQDWPTGTSVPGGGYIPARPLGWELSPFHRKRWVIAWRVLTGRYDALDWAHVEPSTPTAKELGKLVR